MLTDDQRRLLGEFIRAHRERARPPASSGRRRTPGLRREELAAEAGISATWCAWIEQGRPVQASPEALGRLARALFLTRPERAYLFELAGRLDPDSPAALENHAPASLSAAVDAIACPAYGLDRLWNACAWNGAAGRLFVGWLDGAHQRNLLRFVFLEENARALIPDWRERALRLLAEFRADFGHTFRDAGVSGLPGRAEGGKPAVCERLGRPERAGAVRRLEDLRSSARRAARFRAAHVQSLGAAGLQAGGADACVSTQSGFFATRARGVTPRPSPRTLRPRGRTPCRPRSPLAARRRSRRSSRRGG